MNRFSLLHDYNPVGLIYGQFQSAAQDAIIDKLKERGESRRLQGLPSRIKVVYGLRWKFTVSGYSQHNDIYECVDNIRQKSETKTRSIENVSTCEYISENMEDFAKTFNPVEDLRNFSGPGCDRGGCPPARQEAITKTYQAALKEAGAQIIGVCEDFVAALNK